MGCAVRLNEDAPVALAAFLQCLEWAHMSVQFCAADFGVSDSPWSVQVSRHKVANALSSSERALHGYVMHDVVYCGLLSYFVQQFASEDGGGLTLTQGMQ